MFNLTGNVLECDRSMYLRCGSNGVLPKPCKMTDLMEILEKVLPGLVETGVCTRLEDRRIVSYDGACTFLTPVDDTRSANDDASAANAPASTRLTYARSRLQLLAIAAAPYSNPTMTTLPLIFVRVELCDVGLCDRLQKSTRSPSSATREATVALICAVCGPAAISATGPAPRDCPRRQTRKPTAAAAVG